MFSISQESFFVSSRVFSFVLENTQKLNPSIDLSQFEKLLNDDKDNSLNEKIDLNSLIAFFEICLAHQFSFDDFYAVGNKINELHFSLISLLFKLNSNFSEHLKNELGFIKIKVDFEEDEFKLNVEVVDILLLDAKKICTPILKIINGFTDRLFQIYLNNKPSVRLKESSIEFAYRQNFVSNFDIARYVTNEQFFFSRLKNNIYKAEDEEVVHKVQFFLFRDISFSIEEIAGKIDVSVRALQRRLKENDTSFRKIKELVRMELSKKYLSDLSLNIHEVSELLAYSERSAFEKAFKKWYGINPTVFRREAV